MKTSTRTTRAATGTAVAQDTKSNPTVWLNGIPAVAQYTGCSRRTVQNWVASGVLTVKRLSCRHILVRVADVDGMIDRLDEEYRARVAFEEGKWL